MFVEITCNEIVNLNHVAVIRKRHDELDECFKIYVNTIGEDVVVLKFDTEEEMEKTWMWLRNTLPIQEGSRQYDDEPQGFAAFQDNDIPF